jgi:hypothetical protein
MAVGRYSPTECAHSESHLFWLCIPQLPACSFIAVTTYSCAVKNSSNITLYGACYSFCLLLHISEKCFELHLIHMCLTDTYVKWNLPTNFWWALNTKFQRQAINSFGDETCGGVRMNSPSGINSMHFMYRMSKNAVNFFMQLASDYAGVKESICVCLYFQWYALQLDGGQTRCLHLQGRRLLSTLDIKIVGYSDLLVPVYHGIGRK